MVMFTGFMQIKFTSQERNVRKLAARADFIFVNLEHRAFNLLQGDWIRFHAGNNRPQAGTGSDHAFSLTTSGSIQIRQ